MSYFIFLKDGQVVLEQVQDDEGTDGGRERT